MQLADLGTLLKTTGFPVAYHHFEEKPASFPYLVYLFSGSDNFGADNIVFEECDNIQIELYHKKKEPSKEKILEKILKAAELFYDKSESYIAAEKMFVMYYQITI